MNIEDKTRLVVDALEDIKGRDITVLDTGRLTSLFERVVIATGDSNRQTRALAANVRDKMKDAGEYVGNTEGEDTGDWVLLDLGEIVVHVMHPVARAHYNLEEIWDAGVAARGRSAG